MDRTSQDDILAQAEKDFSQQDWPACCIALKEAGRISPLPERYADMLDGIPDSAMESEAVRG